MPNQKMNQFLKDRRSKMNKLAKFRKGRIVKNYHKVKNQSNNVQELQVQNAVVDPEQARKMQFYNSVFQANPNQSQTNPNYRPIRNTHEQSQVIDPSVQKLENLKNKKKKFIKKMQNQKTKKGQPVMRNYIKYALTKIEETLEKQKQEKIKKQKQIKKEEGQAKSHQKH